MKQQISRWFSAGVVGMGLLVGCGSATSTSDENSTPISEAPITEATTTSVELPTTTALTYQRPECSMSAVPPNETNESGQSAEGLEVLECLGDWMITQSPECGECEGVIPFHIDDNSWQMYEPLYIYCYSVPEGYGSQIEGASTIDESMNLVTLQIAVAGIPCDETNKGYHPESVTDQLIYGDTGPRVEALQKALMRVGFLDGPADGAYGPDTIRAVMNFQYSKNNAVDGIAGPNTHAFLGIAYP
jgi:hypothetical protein